MPMWNPWHGCHKCSPGCKNCYVFHLDKIRGIDSDIITKSKTNFRLPLKKDKNGELKIPGGSEVGTCFTSDFFIKDADEWRKDAWKMIKQRSDVNFLIPTKRIHRIFECVPKDWKDGYDNVIFAVSCENQKKADERLPFLLNIKAKHKYIFAAPLLEYIDFSQYLATGEIEMVSVGGESYTNARLCDFDWVRQIKEDCDRYHVKFDFHQTGSNFKLNDRIFKLNHQDEYSQAKKGMQYLNRLKNQ